MCATSLVPFKDFEVLSVICKCMYDLGECVLHMTTAISVGVCVAQVTIFLHLEAAARSSRVKATPHG